VVATIGFALLPPPEEAGTGSGPTIMRSAGNGQSLELDRGARAEMTVFLL
jgi:hypothetical protein